MYNKLLFIVTLLSVVHVGVYACSLPDRFSILKDTLPKLEERNIDEDSTPNNKLLYEFNYGFGKSVLSLDLNLGWQFKLGRNLNGGVYTSLRNISIRTDKTINSTLNAINVRLMWPISEKFDFTFSPSLSFLSSSEELERFPAYGFELGFDNRNSIGGFIRMDIAKLKMKEPKTLINFGIKLKGKKATITTLIVAALYGYTAWAVSGSR